MRILFLGDIVGEPGRKAVIKHLASIKQDHAIDFCIVNGENSAGGRGINQKIATELFKAGADVITTGDHVWDQRELADYIKDQPNLLRPINYPGDAPGEGLVVQDSDFGKIAVLNAQGRTFMAQSLENPFTVLEDTIDKLLADGVKIIFLDFHAETTSETIAMGFHLDGKASAVVGTHTHVQTADERILPKGTAHLTDAGMCGPEISVLGRTVESVVFRFKSSLPTRFPVAKGPVRLCGCIVDVDPATGHATKIERYSRLLEPSEM
ncbi:2',3'-cyclic-nucleotide 2'-phosphodiesterase [Rubritalea halochordaticola]|uniref:2',3'-cyclic-nucleotide 2'-phosphodiesterase n=1 Tax=Rubritalea halochordaticola TaxID=714537 RepID=A0ABP9UYK5_9BACT